MPKSSLLIDCSGTIQSITDGKNKGVHDFPKVSSPKVNVKEHVEFEPLL